eukprot:TRINITY_DN1180_c0_g1_i1.p1 TRINITY_DN1180_c0_g1~~TRINITY_DN1180_c0_g1_i1.p1  ORF type:complete len:1170 (-),score=314.32 TRINITY_DN1180_c0_g1_i1:195-3680(-)
MEALFARFENSKEPQHRTLLAILSAATEVVREHGGDVSSPAAYYMVLLAALEKHTSQPNTTTAATVQLLKLAMKAVSPAVMRANAESVFTLLRAVLETHAQDTTIMRHALICLALLLAAMDSSVYQRPDARHVFHQIVSCCLERRPRVRRAGISAVSKILEKMDKAGIKQVGQLIRDVAVNALQQAAADPRPALYALGLLKGVFALLPKKDAAAVLNAVHPLLAQRNELLSMTVFATLEAALSEEKMRMPADAIVNALAAACAQPPPATQGDASTKFTNFVAAAVQRLREADATLAARYLPSIVQTLLEYLRADKSAAVGPAAKALAAVMVAVDVSQTQSTNSVLSLLADACSVTYHDTWAQILTACARFFEAAGNAPQIVAPLVLSVAGLHGAARAEPISQALGSAVDALGPAAVMQLLPLNLFPDGVDPSQHQPRHWLLPIIKKHTSHGSLQLFAEHILPSADRVALMGEQAVKRNSTAEAEQLRELHQQLWGALEGLCVNPVDTAAALPHVVEAICKALHLPHLRIIAANAITKLAASYETVPSDAGKPFWDARHAVGGSAKQILPQLFTAYSAAAPEQRDALSAAITALAKVADVQIVAKYFETALKKLLHATLEGDASETANERLAMTNVALALVHVLPARSVSMLYRAVQPQLLDADASVQKQSYKVLRHMCERPNFFAEGASAGTVVAAMTEAQAGCLPSARKGRLRTIEAVVANLRGAELRDAIKALLGEAIISTKDFSARGRTAAFDLLVLMANRAEEAGDGETSAATVLGYLPAGLAGATPHMISACVLAMSRLLFEYAKTLAPQTIADTIHTACLLMQHKAREVLNPLLGFVKVAVVCLPRELLMLHTPAMIQAVLGIPDTHKRHFRLQIRVIVERLLRKVGADALREAVPEDQERFITAVSKQTRRLQRQKREAYDAKRKNRDSYEHALEGSEDEYEDDDRLFGDQGEVDETEPSNLLDPRGTARLMAQSRARPKSSFPTGRDGRMLIREEGDEALDDGEADDYDDDDPDAMSDDADAAEVSGPQKRKRGPQNPYRDDEPESDDERDTRGAGGVKARMHQKTAPGKKKQSQQSQQYLGQDYKPRGHTGGDVKRKGKVEPYAYVPLNPHQLNRRSRQSAHKNFEGVVNAAKKGANKGKKQNKQFVKKARW